MILFMLLLSSLLYIFLVLGASVQPHRSPLSTFELKRRQKLKDPKASRSLEREIILAQLVMLKAPLLTIGFVCITALLMLALGWQGGVFAAVVMALLYRRLAEVTFVRRLANRAYKKYEADVLRFTEQHQNKLRVLSGAPKVKEATKEIGSRGELAHMIEAAEIFSDDEKRLVEGALRFKSRSVKQAMTPISAVTTIAYTELLGPLVLDDLHKTGTTIFPVMKGEQVVGLLDTTEHSALHSKESMPVRSVMNTDIVNIDQDELLEVALEKLIAARQQHLIVIDDDGQPVGLLTLTAIVAALTGRRHR